MRKGLKLKLEGLQDGHKALNVFMLHAITQRTSNRESWRVKIAQPLKNRVGQLRLPPSELVSAPFCSKLTKWRSSSRLRLLCLASHNWFSTFWSFDLWPVVLSFLFNFQLLIKVISSIVALLREDFSFHSEKQCSQKGKKVNHLVF